jgi:hypothetical protein
VVLLVARICAHVLPPASALGVTDYGRSLPGRQVASHLQVYCFPNPKSPHGPALFTRAKRYREWAEDVRGQDTKHYIPIPFFVLCILFGFVRTELLVLLVLFILTYNKCLYFSFFGFCGMRTTNVS